MGASLFQNVWDNLVLSLSREPALLGRAGELYQQFQEPESNEEVKRQRCDI